MRTIIVGEVNSPLRLYSFVLKLGIFICLSFFLLDYICYPLYRSSMFGVRLSNSTYIAFVLYLIQRTEEKFLLLLVSSVFISSAFSMSLLCYITGEGFASPYCYAILQVIILAGMFLYSMPPKYFSFMVCWVVAQHFLLLSFLRWDVKHLASNIFGIGFFAFAVIIAQMYVFKILKRIKTLHGLLPICANCKRIRDQEGNWHQAEEYIHAHSEVEFTHGICPDCARKFYPEYTQERRMNKAKEHV